MWPFTRKSENRASYGEALAQAYQSLADGTAKANASQTAAAEFSISLIGRAFATAEVQGAMIPATTLAQLGRNLALRGNAVFDLRADPVGGLILLPVSSWDIFGGPDPATWTYNLNIPGPSAQDSISRFGSDVIHARINQLPESPWAGRSPLVAAGFSADLLASVEQRASQEATARAGVLLPVPPLSAESKTQFLADLKNAKGGISAVENAGGNFARQQTGHNQSDWIPRRFGSDFPAGNVQLRRDVGADVVTAFGIPSGLYASSEGAAIRESWRQFGVAMDGLGEIVAAEISEKLERPVSLSFRKLASIDVAARARAMGIAVQAGLDLNAALALAGLGDD